MYDFKSFNCDLPIAFFMWFNLKFHFNLQLAMSNILLIIIFLKFKSHFFQIVIF